jgi:hypothetical protein
MTAQGKQSARGKPELAEPNRVNVYTCQKCGGKTITIDVHKGVTPFMLKCRASGRESDCDGTSYSAMYRVPKELGLIPMWEWFTPVGSEYNKLSDAMKEHIDKGGLDLRRRTR